MPGGSAGGPAARPSIKSRCSAFEVQGRSLGVEREPPRPAMSKAISDRLKAWSEAIAAETSPQVMLDSAAAATTVDTESEPVNLPAAAEVFVYAII